MCSWDRARDPAARGGFKGENAAVYPDGTISAPGSGLQLCARLVVELGQTLHEGAHHLAGEVTVGVVLQDPTHRCRPPGGPRVDASGR